MLKLDLHIHTEYSDDGAGSPEKIIKILKKKGLDGVAITDHNTVEGGVKALSFSSKDFIVIPGIEISTKEGHILGINVRKDIPRMLSVEETVEKIIDQGGTPVVPHLFRTMSGIKEKKLKKILDKINAIEVYNACSVPQSNLKAYNIAKKYKLGGTGGSDSHVPEYVGSAYTIVDTSDFSIDSVIKEIEKKKTWGEGCVMPLDYRQGRMLKSIKQFFQRGGKRI